MIQNYSLKNCQWIKTKLILLIMLFSSSFGHLYNFCMIDKSYIKVKKCANVSTGSAMLYVCF